MDRVVLFAEDTPLALITLLAPDILVKGGDYRLDEIVGRDVVLARGGRVVALPFVPGYSTTGSSTASVPEREGREVTNLRHKSGA